MIHGLNNELPGLAVGAVCNGVCVCMGEGGGGVVACMDSNMITLLSGGSR